MAALVVLVIFERRRPCGARCTGHLRASRLTVPPSPGEGEFVRSGRAIFGAVDCQFGNRRESLQNNNLQFDACLFEPTWLTVRTDSGEGKLRKTVRMAEWNHYSRRVSDDPNWADDEEYIVRLVGQMVRVSLETVNIM